MSDLQVTVQLATFPILLHCHPSRSHRELAVIANYCGNKQTDRESDFSNPVCMYKVLNDNSKHGNGTPYSVAKA